MKIKFKKRCKNFPKCMNFVGNTGQKVYCKKCSNKAKVERIRKARVIASIKYYKRKEE